MFSMCSELTPRARILDTRIPQLMQPWLSYFPLFMDCGPKIWGREIFSFLRDFDEILRRRRLHWRRGGWWFGRPSGSTASTSLLAVSQGNPLLQHLSPHLLLLLLFVSSSLSGLSQRETRACNNSLITLSNNSLRF